VATTPGVQAFLEELLAPMGGVSLRRMFSGHGIFRDGLMFGLVIRDVLYLKADDATRAAFEAEGSAPFTYTGAKGREVRTSHWRVPGRLFDEPDAFIEWARTAFAAAGRAAAEKSAKAKKPAGRKPTGAKARRG
jgi:DNA transformation protein